MVETSEIELKKFKKLVLEYLSQTKNGSANIEEISKAFNFLLCLDLKEILISLEKDELTTLHKHERSTKLNENDSVVILPAGREFLRGE